MPKPLSRSPPMGCARVRPVREQETFVTSQDEDTDRLSCWCTGSWWWKARRSSFQRQTRRTLEGRDSRDGRRSTSSGRGRNTAVSHLEQRHTGHGHAACNFCGNTSCATRVRILSNRGGHRAKELDTDRRDLEIRSHTGEPAAHRGGRLLVRRRMGREVGRDEEVASRRQEGEGRCSSEVNFFRCKLSSLQKSSDANLHKTALGSDPMRTKIEIGQTQFRNELKMRSS